MHSFELHRQMSRSSASTTRRSDLGRHPRARRSCGSGAIAADELPGLLAEQAARFPRVPIERDTAPCRQELGGDDPQSGTQVVMEVEGAGRTERDLLLEPRKRSRSSRVKRGRLSACGREAASPAGRSAAARRPSRRARPRRSRARTRGSPARFARERTRRRREGRGWGRDSSRPARARSRLTKWPLARRAASCSPRVAPGGGPELVANPGEGLDRLVFHRLVHDVVRELSSCEEVGEPPNETVVDLEPAQCSRDVLLCRLLPGARDAGCSERALEACIGRDDRAPWIRLGAEVVEAVVQGVRDILGQPDPVAAEGPPAAPRGDHVGTDADRDESEDDEDRDPRELRVVPVYGFGGYRPDRLIEVHGRFGLHLRRRSGGDA